MPPWSSGSAGNVAQDPDRVFLMRCFVTFLGRAMGKKEVTPAEWLRLLGGKTDIQTVYLTLFCPNLPVTSCHKLMKWGCWQNSRHRMYYHCSFLGEIWKQLAGKYLAELILGDKSWCITKPLCNSSRECKSRAPLIFCVLMEETPAGLSIKAFCRNLLKLSFT